MASPDDEVSRLMIGTQTLLQQTSTLLHLCLSRFEVGRSTTTDLLRMSKRIAIRESTEDTIRTVLFELAGSAVHGLAVTPTSLSTLLHFLTTQAFPKRTSISATAQAQQARVLSESTAGCLAVLLRVHPSISGATDTDVGMTIALQAATILLDAEVASPGQTSHTLVSIMSEAAQVQLGVFVNILLASIHIHLGQARQRIISLYPLLARAMSLSLRGSADFLTVQDAAGDGAELLSLVFVAIRLAILAAHDPPSDVSERGFGDDAVEALWARVWPDWHRLLTLSFNPGSVNEVSDPRSPKPCTHLHSSRYEQ
jgi:hypothetical protein